MKRSAAEILREYGPFPDADQVAGVTFDGRHVWFASGDRLNAFDPASGKLVRTIGAAARSTHGGCPGVALDPALRGRIGVRMLWPCSVLLRRRKVRQVENFL